MDYLDLARQLRRTMATIHRSGFFHAIDRSLFGERLVLQLLARSQEGVLSPGQITEQGQLTSSRTAAILKQLEKKGQVERVRDPADGRRVQVRLSAIGKQATQAADRRYLEKQADFLAQLGERDAREYVRLLGRIAEVLNCQDAGADKVRPPADDD